MSAARSLPVGQVLAETAKLFGQHWRLLAVLAVGPFVMMLSVRWLSLRMALGAEDPTTWLLVGEVAQVIALTPFLVAWTRLAIFGPAGLAGYSGYGFGTRELRYLAWTLAMIFLLVGAREMFVGMAPAQGGQEADAGKALLGLILIWALLIGMLRLSLLLPAVAAGARAPVSVAWKASSGNVFRLFLTLFLAGSISVLLSALAMPTFRELREAPADASLTATGLTMMLLTAAELLVAAVVNGALGRAYAFLATQDAGITDPNDPGGPE